jgi:hypothetical protein
LQLFCSATNVTIRCSGSALHRCSSNTWFVSWTDYREVWQVFLGFPQAPYANFEMAYASKQAAVPLLHTHRSWLSSHSRSLTLFKMSFVSNKYPHTNSLFAFVLKPQGANFNSYTLLADSVKGWIASKMDGVTRTPVIHMKRWRFCCQFLLPWVKQLFNVFSWVDLGYTASNVIERLRTMDWKWCGKKRSWHALLTCHIFRKGLSKLTKHLSEGMRFPKCVSMPRHPI